MPNHWSLHCSQATDSTTKWVFPTSAPRGPTLRDATPPVMFMVLLYPSHCLDRAIARLPRHLRHPKRHVFVG